MTVIERKKKEQCKKKALELYPGLIHPRTEETETKVAGSPRTTIYFFLGNFSAPMSEPRSLTFSTRSMAPRTF